MGQKVTNHKLGEIVIGIIDGIVPGSLYKKENKSWTETYPDWKGKYVIYIKDVEGKLFEDKYSHLIYPEDDLISIDQIIYESDS